MPENKTARVGREAAQYPLRVPDELLAFLRKEANLNGRSLNSEIITRLEASRSRRRATTATEPSGEYAVLSDMHRAMLAVFNNLPPEKQLALLSLFK